VTGGLPAQDVAEYVGWFMDTNNNGSPARGNGSDRHFGTYTKDQAPGISEYVQWNGSPPPFLPSIPGKQGYIWDSFADIDTGFPFYKMEIDGRKPTVVNFYYWNPVPTGGQIIDPVTGATIDVYEFGPTIPNSGGLYSLLMNLKRSGTSKRVICVLVMQSQALVI
jgi:hypothetical protein